MPPSRNWLFVTPVVNLEIEKGLRPRIVVGRVEFVRADKLPYIRKRFNIPYRISELRHNNPWFDDLLRKNSTLALIYVKTGKGRDFKKVVYSYCFPAIQEATTILSLSRCVYTRRRHREIFGLGVQPARAWQSYVFLERGHAVKEPYVPWGGQLEGAFSPFVIDKHWWNWHRKYGFFFDLLDILYGTKGKVVSISWRRRLKRAALFAGQSWQTIDPVMAFLYNIFSLETLLLEGGRGGKSEYLAKRTEAFLGWAGFWGQEKDFTEKVVNMYDVRNQIVHQADTSKFTIDHLLFSDDLVFNLFLNLVKHVRLFRKQEDVIDFCRKVQAERILGLKSSVRPKGFRAMAPRYSEKDKAEI